MNVCSPVASLWFAELPLAKYLNQKRLFSESGASKQQADFFFVSTFMNSAKVFSSPCFGLITLVGRNPFPSRGRPLNGPSYCIRI